MNLKTNKKTIIFIVAGVIGLLVVILIGLVVLTGSFRFSLSLNPTGFKGTGLETLEFLTYNNAEKGISIQYPSQWEMAEKGSSDPTVVVTFLSPIAVGPNMKINLRVQVDDAGQPLSLDALSNYVIESHASGFPSGKKIEEGVRTLAGLPGHFLVYEDTQQDVPVKWLTVWAAKDTKAYLVTFSSTQADYDQLLPTVQKMIDSFQVQ